MKKNDFLYPAIFLGAILLLFAIPVGAFLTSEVLGLERVGSIWNFTYKFFQDHGSLIAGILAIAGVAWMVSVQRAETAKIIKSNQKVVENEALETRRAKALEYAFSISLKIDLLRGSKTFFTLDDFCDWNQDSDGQNHFTDVKGKLYFIEDFLYGRGNGILALGAVKEFIEFYEDFAWRSGEIENIDIKRIIMLLGFFKKVYEMGDSDIISKAYDPHFRAILDEDPNELSEIFLNDFDLFKSYNPIIYMPTLIMPRLITEIKKKKFL